MIQPEAYGSQRVEGDVLNKNSPCRLICLNTSCPVAGTSLEGLGSVTLLEEFCYWGWS